MVLYFPSKRFTVFHPFKGTYRCKITRSMLAKINRKSFYRYILKNEWIICVYVFYLCFFVNMLECQDFWSWKIQLLPIITYCEGGPKVLVQMRAACATPIQSLALLTSQNYGPIGGRRWMSAKSWNVTKHTTRPWTQTCRVLLS